MEAAYIGILTAGTTSRMRAEALRELTPGWTWQWVDTDERMLRSRHAWQSLAFRVKMGPVVGEVNAQLRAQVLQSQYALIWVDKGVYLWPETVKQLRQHAQRLVHFTPDTAFYANRSRHFNRSLGFYDLLVTTKSFEIHLYGRHVEAARVLLTTQGYDSKVHHPQERAGGRRREVAFIGLAEPDRERCLGILLEHGIPLRLAGRGWGRFLRRWRNSPHLHFEGEMVFGNAYSEIFAGAWVGVGLLSKHFPELHTTRTFEIPACGAILATEDTADTRQFFAANEALFFPDYKVLAVKLRTLFATASDAELAAMADAGKQRLLRDGRDYTNILRAVLSDARVGVAPKWLGLPESAIEIRSESARGIQSLDPEPLPRDPEAADSEASGWARDSAGSKRLCIGFLGADWWGSDARAMAIELRRRGHLVLERNYEDYLPTKWQTPLLKALRRALRGVFSREYNRAVEELLDVGALDMLLVFKGMLLDATTLARFKARGIPCYCFYPDVSFHDHGDNIPQCLPLYNCIFTSKTYHLQDAAVKRMGNLWHFAPHGFDPEVHRPVAAASNDLVNYACDVSFVGYWSVKKEAILGGLIERLPEIDLRIWGPGWARAAAPLRTCWQGRGAYGDEVAAIYSLSKINLGLLSEVGTGVISGDATTARSWQIPGAGGFMLHEDTAEIRTSFAVDREVALFANAEELASQVRRFLADDDTRLALAAAGHRRAMTQPYTYAGAVDVVLTHHAGRKG